MTVVATGLRGPSAKTGPRGVIVDNQPPRKSSGDIDWGRLEQPTSFRRGPATSNSSGSTARKVDVQSDPELDYLDVPAFLRKQAD